MFDLLEKFKYDFSWISERVTEEQLCQMINPNNSLLIIYLARGFILSNFIKQIEQILTFKVKAKQVIKFISNELRAQFCSIIWKYQYAI